MKVPMELRWLPEPWSLLLNEEHADTKGPPSLDVGLGPLLFAPEEQYPRIVGSLEQLPRHGPLFIMNSTNCASCLYDLPSSSRHSEELMMVSTKNARWAVTLSGQIPKLPGDRNTMVDEFVDLLVGNMLELRALAEVFAGRSSGADEKHGELPFTSEPDAFEPQGRLPFARLPWSTTAQCLFSTRDQPRMDVVVQIAIEYKDELLRLSRSLRRILRGERQKTHLGRVQQLDSACMEWLARQPGRTAIEKAGAKQQVLSLVRTENYDTLENRVLKDFLQRYIQAANLYVGEHKSRFEHSSRYKAVSNLRDLCQEVLRDTHFVHVRALTGLPQPNYVLLYDPSYRALWSWYLRLLRRLKVTDDAWRWQRRLWADFVRACVACGIITAQRDRNGFSAALPFQQDLWIREEQDAGSFLHPFDWPNPVCLELEGSAKVLVRFLHPYFEEDTVDNSHSIMSWIGLSGADLLLEFSPTSLNANARRVLLFVWAIHSAVESLESEIVMTQPRRACQALLQLYRQNRRQIHNKGVVFRGLILRSDFSGQVRVIGENAATEDMGTIKVLGASLPAEPSVWSDPEHGKSLQSFLRECAFLATGRT